MITVERLVQQLRQDYPDLTFTAGERARWVASERRIYYTSAADELMHELGHALLHHSNYRQDVDLVKIERAAWNKALALAPHYGVKLDSCHIEHILDDYREWLYQRSRCPDCGQTGLQSRTTLAYHCLNCGARWRANDARDCALRRRHIE